MKKTYFIVLTLCFALSAKATNWLTSFEEAQKIALATNKLILVDFWATWCGPCKKMDSESWGKEEVKQLMSNYVPVKIDIDSHRDLAQKYNVKGIPFIFIMDGNGKVLYKQMSYKTKGEVMSLLNKYAINTAFLKKDLINFYANKNFVNAFRLASKYNDFSVYLKDEIRNDVLKLSNRYFTISKKELKKGNLKSKEAFLQKMELFEIQEKLILNKTDKALKMLNKIDEKQIVKMNMAFYNRLNYVALKQKKKYAKAEVWNKRLNEAERKKAKVFLKAV